MSFRSVAACALSCILALALSAAAVAADQASAPERAEEVVEAEIDWRGTITAIDREHRLITLAGEDGAARTIPADERVEHFDQLAVGDRVHLRYRRSIVVDIRPADGVEPGAYLASDGDSQADEAGIDRYRTEVVTVLSPLVAVDVEAGTISVHDVYGNIRVLHVEKPEHRQALPGLKVGDLLRVRFQVGFAVSVVHAAQ